MAYLSASEKAEVTKSFAAVAGDLSGTGQELFIRLFAAQPSYKALFPFKDAAELKADASFQKHASAVLTLLAKFVGVIDNDAEVKALLDNFQVAHIPRKLSAAHFDNLTTVLIGMLKEKLGGGVTGDTETAWAKTISLFAKTCT